MITNEQVFLAISSYMNIRRVTAISITHKAMDIGKPISIPR